VIETIKADAGTAFDPELVQIFVERYDRIRAAWSMHPDSANEDA
jgi:response regulator RpfG family c-di-GMP phosphodiesterase